TLDTDSQWLSQLTESSSSSGGSSSGAPAPKRRGPGRPRPYGHPTPAVGQGSKGGRARKEQQLSAEDQEKMRIRRERNKVAAAKVRTRRQELTDMLEAETAKLAAEQATIRAELQQLQKEREELELMLATHEPACLLHPALEQTSPDSTTGSQGLRALRPTNLPLPRLQLKQEPHSPLYGQQQQPVARKHEQLSSQLAQPCTQLQPNHEVESAKSLHTPVVSLTPCSGSGSYVFTYPSLAGLQDFLSSESHSCASALRRQSSSGGSGELGAVGSDSLLSPTILSL
uniref:FOS like 1, AP-1 transcription factor subunit n=1 Tax=Petromyzon marinus TaxID=7757 RepID=S4R5J3_PETMA